MRRPKPRTAVPPPATTIVDASAARAAAARTRWDDPIWLGEERLDALEASARQTVRRRAKLEFFCARLYNIAGLTWRQ